MTSRRRRIANIAIGLAWIGLGISLDVFGRGTLSVGWGILAGVLIAMGIIFIIRR